MFAGIWFGVDCAITVRPSKIMPQSLVDSVTESMSQGDVLKALNNCENEPGPMSNILTAGFSHVEEGFETIQEAVAVAADFEGEKLMQRISYISVVAAIAPMLGLLGTVQGMIAAFASLAKAGVAVISLLAANIGQALYTTAAGLCIAIPCLCAFALFRNKANRITLRMEAITLELIKDLRNVEVVKE
jgi:biopolymer transport protein ExbB